MGGINGFGVRGFFFATVCLMAVATLSGAQEIAPSSLTDSGVHIPPNYYTMQPPAVGGSYFDPVFGTRITRLTDAINDPGLFNDSGFVPLYSQHASFNLDDTFLLLYGTNSGAHRLYDGAGNSIRSVALGERFLWSRSNPNWAYYFSGNQILRLDVASNTSTTIATFPEYASIDFGRGQGDLSDNERIIVVGDNHDFFLYDLATGQRFGTLDRNAGPLNGAGWDSAHIAKDGNTFVVSFNGQGFARGDGMEQFDINGNFMVQIHDSSQHHVMGRDIDQTPVIYVNTLGAVSATSKISLDGTATETSLLVMPWGVDVHYSASAHDGWLYATFWDPNANVFPGGVWRPYDGEIVRIRADGSVIERLAHHRSNATNTTYWQQPHGNVSISGKKFVYGSDFMLQGQAQAYADAYVIDLLANVSVSRPFYVLDALGGVHAGGSASPLSPAMPYFGFDAAGDLEMASPGAYVLDRFGGVHAGGGAPPLSPATPYFGFDVAADLELAGAGYYVLDRWGGVHAGGGAPILSPATPYFGFDAAADLELASTGFYVLDRFGGVHAGGGAPPLSPATPYFGFDVAADLELAGGGYYVLDRWGGVHAGGGAPILSPATPYFGIDVARDLELDTVGYYVLDGFGGVHPGGGAPAMVPATPFWGFDVAIDLELR